MIFDQNKTLAELPRDIRPRRFAHELGRGSERRANYVAVTFAGWGRALPDIRSRLESDTMGIGASFSAKTATKQRPNPGLVMSIPSDPVDNQGSFEEQLEAIASGIHRAAELKRWLIKNEATLHSWQALIDNRTDVA